jgi:hypothetical protein
MLASVYYLFEMKHASGNEALSDLSFELTIIRLTT